MPSCTIVPLATASSTSREPHWLALPPRSTPASLVHPLFGATRDSGYSGKTHPRVPTGYGLEAKTGAVGTPVPPVAAGTVAGGVVTGAEAPGGASGTGT